jgi:hypothetical protein
VGGTRVLLELVIRAFRNGATPEAIVQAYDTLDLTDVYAVISYYLVHRVEVGDYLRHRDEDAEVIRREIEAAQPRRPDLRERLLARAETRRTPKANEETRSASSPQ